MDIVLIRHPEPEVVPGMCYGRTDLPLRMPMTPAADAIQETLQDLFDTGVLGARPQAWFSSPAGRCHALAERLAPQAVEAEPRLLEIDFGCWEGRAWDTIPRNELDTWAADLMHFRAHGGESADDMRIRVTGWANALPRDVVCVAAVTHAGVIRQLAASWLGLPLGAVLRWPLAFGAVSVFRIGADDLKDIKSSATATATMRCWNR